MPHKGPGIRTPRTRALEIGAAVAGFEGAADASNYSPQAGVPRALSGGDYRELDVKPRNAPSRSAKSPFRVR